MPRFSIAMALYVTTCLATCLTIAAEPAANRPALRALEFPDRHVEWQYVLLCVTSFGVGVAIVQQAKLIPQTPKFPRSALVAMDLCDGNRRLPVPATLAATRRR